MTASPLTRTASTAPMPIHACAAWLYPGRCPTTPRAARDALTGTCQQWRIPQDTTDVLRLIVSELTTNAILHAHGDQISLVVLRSDDAVWVVVADEGTNSGRPEPSSRSRDEEECGRGLLIVETLATQCGLGLSDGGVAAWARLVLSST